VENLTHRRPNELVRDDQRFRMTNQTLNKGSQVLQKYDYGYGKVDLATGAIDVTKNNGQLGSIDSYIGTTKQSQQRFDYDSIGRLSEAREYRGATNTLTYKEHFDFDRFGNLYRKAVNNSTAGQANPLGYTPIEDNQIEKSTNRFTSATGTTYNEAGMVVGDNKFRSMNFAYDANGRQVKATKANSADAWSVYDALGNRVGTKVNDVWQFVIYDAFGKLVAEYGTQGEGNGGVSYVLQDWQGSVRASVNANGFIQARFDFSAFGEEINLNVGLRSIEQGYSGDATTRQGYGLTEKDSSGLNHTWFRKQEQRAGRWTSPDPYKGSMNLGDPQSINRFSYTQNQPTNFIDPTGLLAEGEACQLNPNDKDADGNPLYQGTVINGRCQSHAGSTVQIYWNFPIFGNYSNPFDYINRGPDIVAGGGETCGVNPVTGNAGINRQPYNVVGNLRNDSKGSGEFGAPRGKGPHKGIDIFGTLGQQVASFLGGKVTFSGVRTGYGNTVEVTHANGLVSKYHHLTSISVSINNRVSTGLSVGTLGQTGNAGGTNPHVDFEIWQGSKYLNPVNILNSPCPK
jgi:RHS repeat-associated protein